MIYRNRHTKVIARLMKSAEAISEVVMRLPRGVYPELCKILRSAQNDTERRARNDR